MLRTAYFSRSRDFISRLYSSKKAAKVISMFDASFCKNSRSHSKASYESGTRTPKENYVTDIAAALDVSPRALAVPDIESFMGLAHTLFALEDIYGIGIGDIDGELCLRLDKSKRMTYLSMLDMFTAWQQEAEKLRNGEITKEEYDSWRYNYPRGKS